MEKTVNHNKNQTNQNQNEELTGVKSTNSPAENTATTAENANATTEENSTVVEDSNSIIEYAKKLFNENKPQEAVECLKRAVMTENAQAMFFYANCLKGGYGIKKNLDEAVKYYKMSAEKGNANGMTQYAILLRDGTYIEKDLVKAENYFKLAIEQETETEKETGKSTKHFIQYNYAKLLYDVGRKNEAVELFKMSADRENIEALSKYCAILYKGEFGIKPNKKEAIKYHKMLIELYNKNTNIAKNTNIIYNCAKMLFDGFDGKENIGEATKYFKMAADMGDPRAVYFYYAIIMNEPEENVIVHLFEAYRQRANKEMFSMEFKILMTEKNITERTNIDFTKCPNGYDYNLIELLINNDLVSHENSALINNLSYEELKTVKDKKKLIECLVEVGNNEYLKKFLNEEFLEFNSDDEKYEFTINLLKKAFENYNYGITDILIDFVDRTIKYENIPEILNIISRSQIVDLDLFNSLLSKVKDKDKYLKNIDNLYREGENGYGQIKRTREFRGNPTKIIDKGFARLNADNSDKSTVEPKLLYEVKYKNCIREITYYDKNTGKPLVKMTVDDKNQINTFNFEGTEYENVENIENEERKKIILQNFRSKISGIISDNYVNCRGFDCCLANLKFASIALENKIHKKPPIIFQDFDERGKLAEMIVESMDNPKQEYILGISSDNHRTVMVLLNGRAILVNTSGNYEYFIENIQKIARQKYQQLNNDIIYNKAELKEKIKVKEINFTEQGTGNCTLVGNVKTALLYEGFDGNYEKFINSCIKLKKLIKLAKLAKEDNKEFSSAIGIYNENEIKEIEETAKIVQGVIEDLTSEKNINLQLINNSKDLGMVIGEIDGFKESVNANINME